MIGASLVLLVIAADAGCQTQREPEITPEQARAAPGDQPRHRVVAPQEPEITPEQARAALLKLDSLPGFLIGEHDFIRRDLKTGAVARASDSVVTIGRFVSCNLKEKTWQMHVSGGASAPSRLHYSAGANGEFEFQADGTWRAILLGSYIT